LTDFAEYARELIIIMEKGWVEKGSVDVAAVRLD
jgi:hypothetical protein